MTYQMKLNVIPVRMTEFLDVSILDPQNRPQGRSQDSLHFLGG